MGAEWPTVRLGDLIEASLGKMLDKEKNKGSEKPYLGNSNVRWGFFDLTNLSEMRFEDNESARYGIKRGDLIVCEGGEPGRCAIWTEDVLDMRIQKALHRIRTKSALNNYYLYYWFLFSGTRGLLEPFFTGTTIKHLTGKALKELEIQLPPIEYQESVAGILNSIDDKIALNHSTNRTLEKIAQAIFKSWFVDFEPTRAKIAAKKRWLAVNEIVETSSPTCYSNEFDTDKPNTQSLDEAMTQAAMTAISGKTPEELARLSEEQQQHLRCVAALFPDTLVDSELGEIPENWYWSEIGNEVTIVGGGTPRTSNLAYWENGEINWTTPKDMSNLDDKILIKTDRKITQEGLATISSGLLPVNTVLMSSRAPVGYLAIAKIPLAINQGYIAMKCEKLLTAEYVVQWTDSVMDEIKQRAGGTTFAEISKKNFKVIPVLVPNSEVITRYSEIIENLYENITTLLQQNRTLTETRDSLLPKLLSGELTIDEVVE